MDPNSNRNAMAEACIEAARQVNRHGSPALQQAMRVVLYVLGCELSQRPVSHGHSVEAFARIIGKRAD